MLNQQRAINQPSRLAVRGENETRVPRVSLWTVPEKLGGAFFVLLVVQGTALVGAHAWRAFALAQDAQVVDTVLEEILLAVPLFVLAGILSMIELEGALTLSVWYESRVRRQEAEWRAAIYEEARMDLHKEYGTTTDEELARKIREEEQEKLLAELAEKAKRDEEIRQRIWDEGYAAGERAALTRPKQYPGIRDQAMHYPNFR